MNSKTFCELEEEISRANSLWGKDNPDGTSEKLTPLAASFKALVDVKADLGRVTWADILCEEVAEAISEPNLARLRQELIQVAAVAIRWVESIDGRVPPVRYSYVVKLSNLELSALSKREEKRAEPGGGNAELRAAINCEVELRTRRLRNLA